MDPKKLDPAEIALFSEKVDVSPEGLLKHNLIVLQAIAGLALPFDHEFKVELCPNGKVAPEGDFMIIDPSGDWGVFTYEEALEFLVSVTSELSKGVRRGSKD